MIPGTGNRANNYLGHVRSQVLEKNLLRPINKSIMNS